MVFQLTIFFYLRNPIKMDLCNKEVRKVSGYKDDKNGQHKNQDHRA